MHERAATVPVDELRHGAVWRVTLMPRRKRLHTDLATAWETLDDPFDVLVLVTLPYREWPRSHFNYYRSRILVGDLRYRLPEEAIDDFKRLLRQTPPVLRNWRKNLDVHRERGRVYQLLWSARVTTLRV